MPVPGYLPLIWQAFAARLPLCRPSLADWRFCFAKTSCFLTKKNLLVTAGFLRSGR
jgi:hypothetical protein